MNSLNTREAQVRTLLQQGEGFKQAGKLAEAEAAFRNALRLAPDHPEAIFRLASIASAVGRVDDALKLLDRATALAPANPNYEFARGVALESRGRWEEAMASYRRVSERLPDAPEPYDNIGNVLMGCGRVDDAIASYRKAIEARPDYADAWSHLGLVLKMKGDMEGAAEAYAHVLKLQPDRVEVYRLMTQLRRYRTREESDAGIMERHLGDPKLSPVKAMHLHFALGKVHDDLGEYEAAFAHFREANRLRRADYHYDIKDDIETLNKARAVFTKDFFAQRSGYGLSRERPIFIVGMPRSGSTLVEQILSSHPDVIAAGEVPDLWRTICSVGRFPELAERIDAGAAVGLATEYVDRMKIYNRDGLPRTTDKELFNFIYVGVIRLLFPNAKVICCRREPMDTCFSIWMQYFPAIGYFANDQYEVGRFYRIFDAYMKHWHEVLPGFVLDFEHRALIDDQETQTRRLLEFCELDWSDACLRFHESGRVAKTASTTQVRQPLNDKGFGHWRHYEHQLGEMCRALDEPLP
ncbi:MAG: tetratricopeptide repeat protein [Gammaproteobacteria bacterium]|nr:tetratricopeptide repeat protein [Gammaproteobacteria bacterium]